MPPGNNHKITNSDYLDIFSYILDKNNIKNINLKNIVTIKMMKRIGFLSVIQAQLIDLKIENHYSKIKN